MADWLEMIEYDAVLRARTRRARKSVEDLIHLYRAFIGYEDPRLHAEPPTPELYNAWLAALRRIERRR